MFMYALSVYMCEGVHAGICTEQKTISDALELELQVIVSPQAQVLGTECQPSEGPAKAAISPEPLHSLCP